MKRGRILWCGDTPTKPTGFGRVSGSILRHLANDWDVSVLGVNYDGSPHDLPYRIFPAAAFGSPDMYGYSRFLDVVALEKPDVILLNSDPWIVGEFAVGARGLVERGEVDSMPPMIGYVPVDAPGMKAKHAEAIAALDVCVFYTDFGYRVARGAGFKGDYAVIPHGIDLEMFRGNPDKLDARKRAEIEGVPPGAFLIGNVNRNQPRKRIDLTLHYFSRWLRQAGSKGENALLYLHMDPHDVGGDLDHMIRALGLFGKAGYPTKMSFGFGGRRYHHVKDGDMRHVYSALDVQVSTTLGEGWGLSTMEGMACGVPQIVPDFAALGEWAGSAAEMVPCSGIDSHKNYESGGIGGVVDERAFLLALTRLIDDAGRRAELSAAGLALVNEPRFRWEAIAARFDEILTEVVGRRQQLKVAS